MSRRTLTRTQILWLEVNLAQTEFYTMNPHFGTLTGDNHSLVTAGGEGNGNPLQYSCLENPMVVRAWWAAVHGVMTERLPFHFSLSRIGEGNGNLLQCSCLENPRDRGAWWAAVYGVAQSRTRLKRLSSSSSSDSWWTQNTSEGNQAIVSRLEVPYLFRGKKNRYKRGPLLCEVSF